MPTRRAIIYTRAGCPFCTAAKKQLRANNMPYREIKVAAGADKPTLPDGRTAYTFPQIFLAMGGFDAMKSWIGRKPVRIKSVRK